VVSLLLAFLQKPCTHPASSLSCYMPFSSLSPWPDLYGLGNWSEKLNMTL
jgi:hypothetical protein